MRRRDLMKPAFYVLLSAGIIIACQKEHLQTLPADAGSTISSARPQAIAKTNGLVLKTFSHSNRTYHFVYAPNGILDSIIVTGNHPYVYRVWYMGAHLDSVVLVDRGLVVSVNRNFEYKGNLISSYEYFDRIHSIPDPWRFTFTYDGQKRLVALERKHYNQLVSHAQFSYDAADNIVTWNDFTAYSANFTYDSQLNPLHLVPDLFAIMVEEPWIGQYSFSAHNSVTQTFFGGGGLSYQNQYNSNGQLVTKLVSDNGDSFSFTYQ
jgi:hypothetical protein